MVESSLVPWDKTVKKENWLLMGTPFKILVLPGDGVGPEVVAEALKVLQLVEERSAASFELHHDIIGGPSYEKYAVSIRPDLLTTAIQSHAVLFGSEEGPPLGKAIVQGEAALLQLRKRLNVYANLRPCRFYSPSLLSLSVLKPEIAAGTDFTIVRENTGGAYFGPKVETADYGSDTWAYSREEVEKVSRVAGALARQYTPPLQVTSLDKGNVLASGRLWRRVVTETFEKDFPDVHLTHQLADSAAMLMMKNPRSLNGVVLTENTFGDILSDESSTIPGSLGLLPSASLSGPPGNGLIKGLYEPIHGTAPDIAGKGVVNPIGQILSLALLLRYSCGLEKEASAIETAVSKVLDSKAAGGLEVRTKDLGGSASTSEVGDAVCQALRDTLTVE